MLGFITWQSEASIRSAGYVLQLIGMIFAVRGLLGIRAHFSQPLLRDLFLKWLLRFPKWRHDTVVGVATATCSLDGFRARVEVWSPDDPEKTIEERLNALVQNLANLRQGQQQHSLSIDDLKDSHEEHKKKVEEQTKKLEEDLRSDLESLHINDLITSLVGLTWLTTGITMSTLSTELYLWLH